MRLRNRTTALLVVALAVAAPVTATAGEPYVPTFTRETVYLHAGRSPGVGNLEAELGRAVTWDRRPPSSSTPAVYVGNNYGRFVDGDHSRRHFLSVAGDAVGDLENLAFQLYFKGPQSAIACDLSLSFELVVDGRRVLAQDYRGSAGMPYRPVDDTTFVTEVALTNLWEADQALGLGLPTGATTRHEVYVNIQNFYLCNEVVWLYDSTSTPSQVTVNLPRPGLAGYTEVDVLDPPPPFV